MIYSCRKCRISIFAPDVAATVKAEVAALIRTHHPIQAIVAWRDATESSLTDSKALIYHITDPKGVCNRCGTELLVGEATECPKCRALNLDW